MIPFWEALKIARTVQAYGMLAEKLRLASEMDELLRASAMNAVAEEARHCWPTDASSSLR